MCKEIMPPESLGGGASPLLSRIAETLGVPVSRFYEAEGGQPSSVAGLPPEAEALLALVGIYFKVIDASARKRFVDAVMATAKVAGDERERQA